MLKELPKSIESRSGQLLIKLGIIKKHGKGIYFFTPFGMHLINNVKKELKDKLAKNNFSEIDIPIINLKNNFDDNGFFVSKDIDGKFYFTSGPDLYLYEDFLKSFIKSYKDLPVEFYYITKRAFNDNKASEELLNSMVTEVYKSFYVSTQENYEEKIKNYTKESLDFLKSFGIKPIAAKKNKDSQGIIYGWANRKGRKKSAYCSECNEYFDINYMEIIKKSGQDEEI